MILQLYGLVYGNANLVTDNLVPLNFAANNFLDNLYTKAVLYYNHIKIVGYM